jgi:hypothetical protein
MIVPFTCKAGRLAIAVVLLTATRAEAQRSMMCCHSW